MTIRSFIINLFQFFKSKEEPVEETPEPLSFAHKPTTSIQILVGDQVVGAVQSITVTESTAHPKLTAHRIRFDKARVEEIFSQGFVHAKSQRYPVHIQIIEEEEVTIFRNAWILDVPFTYMTVGWIIADEMTLEAEKMFTEKK